MTTPDLTAEAPCWLCGDLLHQAADKAADEWAWVDAGGHQTGLNTWFRCLPGGDPYARWAFLRDELARVHKAKRAEPTWLYHACMREYSALLVATDGAHGTHHVHQVHTADLPHRAGQLPPQHCGWPAWLRPSGWHCRVCKTVLERFPLEVAA